MRDLCRCGHHRDMHFKDERGRPEACLGVHCDCRYYDDEENRRDTPVLPAINYADWPRQKALPIDPDAQQLVDRLTAENAPRRTGKRILAKRER